MTDSSNGRQRLQIEVEQLCISDYITTNWRYTHVEQLCIYDDIVANGIAQQLHSVLDPAFLLVITSIT